MKQRTDGITTIAPNHVKKIGIVGTGLIGSAWAAHFLARGLDVVATDPGHEAEKKLRATVKQVWPVLKELGLEEDASQERLTFAASIGEALGEADFIQESVPEKESIKDEVISTISQVVRPEVVIASSTSGIVPSRLQVECRHPERFIVGHPFNPVYLVPLVEVVGGKRTAPETVCWAMDFYRHWGKTPLHCRNEVPGHLANRLQDAVLSEALQLIVDGVATTAEVDTALTAGPGLRWALMGPSLLAHMAAGDSGLREVFNGKFGTSYYSHFQGPEPTEFQVDQILEGTQAQVAGRSIREMEKMRDEFLVEVIKLRANICAKYGFDSNRFK